MESMWHGGFSASVRPIVAAMVSAAKEEVNLPAAAVLVRTIPFPNFAIAPLPPSRLELRAEPSVHISQSASGRAAMAS